MTWRLIRFIIVFFILLLFIMFNLENKCNISFGFFTIKDAPVFLTVFFSLIIGMICAILYILVKRKRTTKPDKRGERYDANNEHYGID